MSILWIKTPWWLMHFDIFRRIAPFFPSSPFVSFSHFSFVNRMYDDFFYLSQKRKTQTGHCNPSKLTDGILTRIARYARQNTIQKCVNLLWLQWFERVVSETVFILLHGWKTFNDQAYSCPRAWRLSLAWQPVWGVP